MSENAYRDLKGALEGLTEEQSWASVSLLPGEYLHSEGSILSQIAHVANGKFIYASVGFRSTEIRWRELSPQIDAIWPSLSGVVGWLDEAHTYFMESWNSVEDFEELRPRFCGKMLPGWELVSTVIGHDHYHAGQIQLMRSSLEPSSVAPAKEGDLWETYCKDFPCW